MRTTRIAVYLFLLLFSYTSLAFPTAAQHGMVVSEQKIASQIGVDILRSGGNAIDAAVAVGYALAVVNPCCGNIGGGGFMTIHLASGKDVFINFREKAPLKANKDLYLDKQGNVIENLSSSGWLAIATPGTVLGFETVLQHYGTMTRKQVMMPAIKLAEHGYVITPFDAKWFNVFAKDFRQEKNVAAIFLKNGQPLKAGDILVQKDLANTLTKIAEDGANAFYKGDIAKSIVKASHAHGGILTLEDFEKYTVQELPPIRCDYRGYTIISAPPPSSGGTILCEMLNILENFPLGKLGYHSVESTRIIVEAMRYGFNDRNRKMGDPDFVKNPTDELTSKAYAATLSEQIRDTHVNIPGKTTVVHHEFTDTTHYSIVDNKGNAVATTYTLNGFFGAKVMAEKTGFFLNNEMDDFASKPGAANKFNLVQYHSNLIQPGKRPLSSMTPTIVMKNGRVLMVLGSPGGPRILTSVLLTIVNAIDYKMNIQQAVNAPRFHYQADPDIIYVEPMVFSPSTVIQLRKMGYHLSTPRSWSSVEAIHINSADNTIYGANDYRRPAGAAIGY